jgi:hypothetical protein
MTMAAENRP